MFSGICAALAEQAEKWFHGDFLKEKGLITSIPKDATPKSFFFYTKTSSVFILIFIQKQRVVHNVSKNILVGKKHSEKTKLINFFFNSKIL